MILIKFWLYDNFLGVFCWLSQGYFSYGNIIKYIMFVLSQYLKVFIKSVYYVIKYSDYVFEFKYLSIILL